MYDPEQYSREFIFERNGQFDAFVELTFAHGSEAYKKFGRVLMGTFHYTREERNEMEKLIKEVPANETNGYIKFSPSDVPKELGPDLREDLDKNGILNTDVVMIRSLNIPRSNRYTTEGERKIQNQIVVEFDGNGLSVDQMHVGNLRMRIRGGYPLIKEEWEQYCGLELYHNPTILANVMKSGKVPGDLDEKAMRYYFLTTKMLHSKLNDQEKMEHELLLDARVKTGAETLIGELKRSNEKMKDLATQYRDRMPHIIKIASQFDTEVILPYKFPIWWNLERFLHIYLRHVKETNVGDRFIGKSLFKYSFEDVQRIVSNVIEREYKEIEKHFATGTKSNFKRQGKRAVYYDGVYYRFEIAPSGLLVSFHPEEDLKAE